MDYYKRAMTRMADKLGDATFYVFTQDIDSVTEATRDWGFRMRIEDGAAKDFEKLGLMSSCEHFIITNSTYDWWAQYLSANEDKIVFAPSRWFAQECPCDIYLDNWELLEC